MRKKAASFDVFLFFFSFSFFSLPPSPLVLPSSGSEAAHRLTALTLTHSLTHSLTDTQVLFPRATRYLDLDHTFPPLLARLRVVSLFFTVLFFLSPPVLFPSLSSPAASLPPVTRRCRGLLGPDCTVAGSTGVRGTAPIHTSSMHRHSQPHHHTATRARALTCRPLSSTPLSLLCVCV